MVIAWLITIIFLICLWWLARRDLIKAVALVIACLPIYLVRLEIGPVPTTALELGIYLLSLFFVIKIWRKKAFLHWDNFYILMIAWLVIGLVSSAFFSEQRVMSLGLWKGWMLDPVLLSLIIASALKAKKQMNVLYLGGIFLLGWQGLIIVWQIITNNGWTEDGRLAGVFESPNYLAMLTMPILLWSLCRIVLEKRYKFWELICWGLGLLALMCSVSLVGIGGLAGGLILVLWLHLRQDWRKVMLLMLGLVMAVGIFGWWMAGNERIGNMMDLSKRSSITVRAQVWRIDWGMIADNYLTGIGLGNYEKSYIDYAPKFFDPPLEWRMLHGHNLFLHTWVSLGLAGMLFLIVILLVFYARALKIYKQTRWWWMGGVLVLLLAWVATGMFDTPLWKNDLAVWWWIMIGVILASNKMLKKYVEKEEI